MNLSLPPAGISAAAGDAESGIFPLTFSVKRVGVHLRLTIEVMYFTVAFRSAKARRVAFSRPELNDLSSLSLPSKVYFPNLTETSVVGASWRKSPSNSRSSPKLPFYSDCVVVVRLLKSSSVTVTSRT
jgi:hypothetical protein